MNMVTSLWYIHVPIWVLYLDYEGVGALEDAGGSLLGFRILITIWICSLAFDKYMS